MSNYSMCKIQSIRICPTNGYIVTEHKNENERQSTTMNMNMIHQKCQNLYKIQLKLQKKPFKQLSKRDLLECHGIVQVIQFQVTQLLNCLVSKKFVGINT